MKIEKTNTTSTTKARYTLYEFPSLSGTPRNYRFKFTAWIAAKLSFGVCELKDNVTGEYYSFWA